MHQKGLHQTTLSAKNASGQLHSLDPLPSFIIHQNSIIPSYAPKWMVSSLIFQKFSGKGLTEPLPQTPPLFFLELRPWFALCPHFSGTSRTRFGLLPQLLFGDFGLAPKNKFLDLPCSETSKVTQLIIVVSKGASSIQKKVFINCIKLFSNFSQMTSYIWAICAFLAPGPTRT